jgi:soluble lytic murein transglycosylase
MKFKPIFIIAIVLALIIFAALMWHFVYKNRFLKAIYPEHYSVYVDKYAQQNNLDHYLIYAVIKNESSFKPKAYSSIGAMGLMQLTPQTFEWAQSKTPETENYTNDDLYNPEINIHYGTLVLSSLIIEFGSVDTSLAAYHAGRGRVKGWLIDRRYSADGKKLDYIPYADTRAYVKKVLETRDIYKKLYDKSGN